MNPILKDLTVKFDAETSDRLIKTWTWLMGADKRVVLISAIGDMFVIDEEGKVYWLDIGAGELSLVAGNNQEFEGKLRDMEQVNEWFMIDLTTKLRQSERKLKDGQVYSYKKLPIIGGKYHVDNFAPLSIEEHFGYTGDLHRQMKDLPDGTTVEIKIVD
jgi:hypothetical protein